MVTILCCDVASFAGVPTLHFVSVGLSGKQANGLSY